ncbi:hypothetical protein [Kineosporia sp. NBRC 101731]|uniref:hypothetical protein n=1 Tax=Kineosporia sp. NBRC 101731 TaxID=3032199 RepID=UPI0024A2BECD|nr:hypothetical protein [Kineosporia sp. NBRC 101731]GLY29415.1 hypothetical protein Kisp02_27800 [Kineosporia sp. NBRC 101731]
MADIFLPGDDLDAARAALDKVRENIDISGANIDFDQALGRDLARAAGSFESAWSDGRFQLLREIDGIRDKFQQVSDAFADTDAQAAESLVTE